MSSLQAQLAALNGTAGKNPGAVYASSKKHSDALGRGVHYSVQQGHAVHRHGYQASILEASAKDAADVPLNVLEENFRDAIEALSDLDPPLVKFLTLCDSPLTSDPTKIKDLLVRIGSLLGELNALEACLHVIEYLIRKFRVHIHNMEDLLWVLLPQADVFPAVVHRGLQLVDLQSNQSYLWLRPYTDSKIQATVPRSLMARHIMQRADLIRACGSWSQSVAALTTLEGSDGRSRRGTSHVLSFTAALFVEGLAWLATANQLPDQKEAVVRALLPSLVQACRSRKVDEWRGWGHVLASVLAETMDLAQATQDLICESIIKASSSFEQRSSALLTVLSVLVPPQQCIHEEGNYLQLTNAKLIGCDLSDNVYAHLKEWKDLSAVLVHLQQQNMTICPLLATLIVKASSENEDVKWATSLVAEPSLARTWNSPGVDLVCACSAFLAQIGTGERLDSCRVLLKAFHHLDASSCERGVASVVQNGLGQHGVSDQRKQWIDLLRDVVRIRSDDINSEDIPVDMEIEASMLPPRVALEHVEPSIRLGAIERLNEELEEGGGLEVADMLLRCWSVDDDEEVASLAVSNVLETLKRSTLGVAHLTRITNMVLEGLQNWSNPDSEKCLQFGLKVVGYIGSIADNSTDNWKRLLLAVSGFLGRDPMSASAADSVLLMMHKKKPTKKDSLVSSAFDSLVSCPIFTSELIATQTVFPESSGNRSDLLWVMLSYFADRPVRSKISRQTSDFMLQVSFAIIGGQRLESPSEKQADLLKRTLIKGIDNNSVTGDRQDDHSEVFQALAGVQSKELFRQVSSPVIETVVAKNKLCPPILSILEAVVASDTDNVKVRLLDIAMSLWADSDDQSCFPILVPCLSLLEHNNMEVRNLSLRLTETICPSSEGNSATPESTAMNIIKAILKAKTSASMGTQNFLSSTLQRAFGEIKEIDSAREFLLGLVSKSAVGSFSESAGSKPKATIRFPIGGCRSATIMLNAMEGAGESVFPLSVRWKFAGSVLFDCLLQHGSELEGGGSVSGLAEAVIIMLKGVLVRKSQNVSIVSGPRAGGGRSRSYSVGRNEGSFILPYPKEMLKAIDSVLRLPVDMSCHRRLTKLLHENVLSNQTWGQQVFLGLPRTRRKEFARACLHNANGAASELNHARFSELPLDATDVSTLMSENGHDGALSVSILADFVIAHSAVMRSTDGVSQLLSELFSCLRSLASSNRELTPDQNHALGAVAQALIKLWAPGEDNQIKVKPGPNLKRWSSILTDGVANPMLQYKTRTTMVDVLISMYKLFPQATGDALHNVMKHGFAIAASNMEESRLILSNGIMACFEQDQISGGDVLEVLDLIRESTSQLTGEVRSHVLNEVALSLGSSTGDLRCAPGALHAVMLVGGNESLNDEVLHGGLPVGAQVMSLVLLLDYVKVATAIVSGETPRIKAHSYLPSITDILRKYQPSFSEKKSKPLSASHKKAILDLAAGLVLAINNSLRFETIQQFFRKSQGDNAALCLRMWQDLIVIDSTIQNISANEKGSSISTLVNETREYLQRLLPSHIFVAAVTSLMKEGETNEVARALRLVVDRISEVEPNSSDVALFVELIPDLVEVIKSDDRLQTSSIALQQAALVAIEHIARMFALEAQKERKVHFFLSALGRSADLLSRLVQSASGERARLTELDEACVLMISSVALCAATLVRATGARCISSLPKLVKRLVLALSNANKFLLEEDEAASTSLSSQASVMQTSVLRALTAVAESVPQFLSAHLHILLTESALLSSALRQEPSAALSSALILFDKKLADESPPRLVIPAVCRASKQVTCSSSLLTLLSIVQMSLDRCDGAVAAAQHGPIHSMVTAAFQFDCDSLARKQVVEAGSNVFLSLVMKLSEIQLRRILSSFKEWRGETGSSETSPYKRYAFWVVCSLLAKHLGSLFLPCLSTIIEDVTKELELAKNEVYESTGSANKKRRLLHNEESKAEYTYAVDSIRVLKPLLLCLETCLLADARAGGQWLRADVNSRYHAMLGPLGKLLIARIPSNLPGSSEDGYEYVVTDQTPDTGNVVGCLTALANAAGSEELWKPLNYHILQACDSERSQVRKAGLGCLISLMKTLGEEYMILLPECLPTLSELLEDSDDTVSSMARECITMAEDLIGESLEDSLR